MAATGPGDGLEAGRQGRLLHRERVVPDHQTARGGARRDPGKQSMARVLDLTQTAMHGLGRVHDPGTVDQGERLVPETDP